MAEPATGLTPAPAGGQPPFSFAAAPTSPGFDVADLLPQQAAERLRKLRIRRDDAYAVTISHAELQSLTVERLQADQRLRQLRAHPHDHGYNLPGTDARVVAQQKLVDKLTADLKRLNERSEMRAAAFQTASAPLAACEDWLRHGKPSGVMLQDYDGPAPKLNKGETVLDAVERLRRRTRELKATMHTIRSAPFPSSHARAKIKQEIEALVMQGEPVVSNVLEHDAAIIWPSQQVRSLVHADQRALAFSEVPDTLALMCWLHGGALIKKLDALIEAEADDKAALSQTDRELRTAEVMGDLLAVERDESALVWSAMAQSLPVEHRADCDPLAILGCRLVTVPRAAIGPSTSPLVYDIVQPGR